MKERIKGAFTKKKIFHFLKMALFVVALSLILLSLLGTVAHATGLVDDTINAENLYSKYPLSNYQLDFYVDNSWSWLPWNWLDGIGKSVQYGLYCITNFVWTISLYLSNATGYVVQEAYKLDFINDMADSIGKSIQTLAGVTENGFGSTGFYVGSLLLIILIIGIYVAYTGLIKRETSKAVQAVINFLVVFVLSASFIAYAPDYIKKINEFSSDISTASLDLGTKIMLPNSDSEGKDSVNLIRDSLFSIQVEQPWLLLQFGNSNAEEIGTDRVEALVSASPEDEDGKTREEVVKTEIEDNDNNNLTIPQVVNRLGMVFFLLFFNLGITIFVFLLTGMMLFSQILFIIFAMFLPISFLLSMIPSYESMAKQAIVTGRRTDRTDYPITAVRETIINALVHRDYSIHTEGMPIQLIMFEDRIEIHNPGGLYGRTTIDQLGKIQPDTRNPVLASALETLGITENRYSGIPTIRMEMEKYNLRQPEFLDERGSFIVKLYKESKNDYEDMSNDEETNNLIVFCKTPRTRKEICDYLGLNSVTYAIQTYVNPLVEAGVIKLSIPDKPKSPKQLYYSVEREK